MGKSARGLVNLLFRLRDEPKAGLSRRLEYGLGT